MKPLKVSLLTNMVAPYRVPTFKALASHESIQSLRVLTCVEREFDRQWEVENDSSYTVKRLAGLTINIHRRGTDALRILHLRFGIISELILNRPDRLIIGDASWTSYIAMLSALALKVPFVIWSEITTSSKVTHGILNRVRVMAYKRAISCIASGQLSKEFLRQHECPSEKIWIANNSVDNELHLRHKEKLAPSKISIRNELKIDKSAFVLLFVGQLISRKRILETTEAIARISHIKNVHFLIGGEGPLRDEITQIASKHQFNSLTLLGHVSGERLAKLYTASDAVILLSDDEPWGMVINEALLYGKRYLCTRDVGAAVELLTPQNGRIISTLDRIDSEILEFIQYCEASTCSTTLPISPKEMAQQIAAAIS